MNVTTFLDLSQFMPQLGDSIANHASVDFQLALTLTEPAADAAARLLFSKMAPHAPQSWQKILQLCELDLQAAFTCSSVQTEDIENKGGTVDDLRRFTERAFKIGLLRGTQVIIENHHIGIESLHEAFEFFNFARPDIGFRYGSVESLRQSGYGASARRVGEPLEFVERALDGPTVASPVNADEDSALRCRSSVHEFETTHPFSTSCSIRSRASSTPILSRSIQRVRSSRLHQLIWRFA